MQDSASSLKDGHGFGEELLRSRESQANHFEQSSSLIRNELLGVYGDRELTQANLRDSITTVGTLKEVYFGLAQAVNKFKDEMEALQLDVKQGKELQQQFADLQKRYVGSAQTLGDEIDNLFSSIETGANQANSKVNEITQQIRGLNASADTADKDATAALGASAEFAANSLEERRRIAMNEFGNKYQILGGEKSNEDFVDASDVKTSHPYVEDPNFLLGDSGPEWTPVLRYYHPTRIGGFDKVKGEKHFDGYWVNWNSNLQESQRLFAQAKTYREQAAQLEQSEELKHWRGLKTQWEVVTRVGNDSKNSIKEIQRLLTVDAPGAQEEAAKASKRLQKIQGLLPTLNQRLELAKGELQSSQAKLDANWSAYSTSANLHLQTVFKALDSYSQWDSGNLQYEARLDEIETWTERQESTLAQKAALVQTLKTSLQERLAAAESQLPQGDGDDRDAPEHQKALLQQSLKLVDNVSSVFELQKGSLKNLQQLEESHESISFTEQSLMRDYVSHPDTDGIVLEKKLQAAQQTLAETDRLAKQAEVGSKALDSFTLNFKDLSLEGQNEYIQITQQLQPVLSDLEHAIAVSTQTAQNLRDAQKKLNGSASDIKQALDEAIADGDQEAVALRDVANYQGMKTAAQLYARDFKDLTDGTKNKGMKRSYGFLLEKYAQDAQNYESLKTLADANAKAARLARTAAEDKLEPLKQQQQNQAEINDLRTALNHNLDNQAQIQQRLDAALLKQQIVGAVIQQTEATLEDLLNINGLYLAQARLEQKVAADRASDLQQDITSYSEQNLQENQYEQLEKVIGIFQIGQQQTEVQLQEALNEIRSDLGMEPLNLVPSQVNQQKQMQTLLQDLQTLQTEQPEMPARLKTLLGEVEKDLNSALQGEEAVAIQGRLNNLVTELTTQNKNFMDQVNRLGAENEKDMKLLGLLHDGNSSTGKLQDLDSILSDIREGDDEFQTLMQGIGDLHLQLGINSQRIAYAEKLVEFSGIMDTKLHEAMTDLINRRIEARRAEGGGLWSKIRLGITIIGGAVATGLTFGGAAPLAALAVGLAVGVMNSIDGAVRGDWMDFAGGLLSIGGAVTGYLGQVNTLTKTATVAIQQSTSSAYRSTRAFIKGEDFIGALEAAGGLIAVTNYGLSSSLNGLSEMDRNVTQEVLDTLQYVPQNLSTVIAAVKNDDFLGALDGGFNIAVNLGQGFTPLLGSSIGEVVDQANKFGNTALILAQGAKNDGFIDLQGLVFLYRNDIFGNAEDQKRKAAIQTQGEDPQVGLVAQAQGQEPQGPRDSTNNTNEENGYQEAMKETSSSAEGVEKEPSHSNHRQKSHSVVPQKDQHSKPLGVNSTNPSTPPNPDTNGSNSDTFAASDNLAPSGTAQAPDISATPTAAEVRSGASLTDRGLNGEVSTPASDAITPTADEERLKMSFQHRQDGGQLQSTQPSSNSALSPSGSDEISGSGILPPSDQTDTGAGGASGSTVRQSRGEEDTNFTDASQGAGGASQGNDNIGFGGGPQGQGQPEPQEPQLPLPSDQTDTGAGGASGGADQQVREKEGSGSTDASQGAGGASQGNDNIGFGGGPQGSEPSTPQSSDRNSNGAGSASVVYDALKRFRNALTRFVWTDAAEDTYQRSKDPALEKVQSNPHLEVLDQIVKETPSVSGDLLIEGAGIVGSRKQGVDLVSQTLEQADYLIQLNKTGGVPEAAKIGKGNQVLGAAENVLTGERFFGRSSKAISTKDLHPALAEELEPYAQIAKGWEKDKDLKHYGPPGAHAEINALNKALWATDPTGEMLTAADFSNFNSVAVWLGKGGPYAMPRCPNCWFLTPNVNYLGPQPLENRF
ncbi:MAG: hypothetical protein KME45_19030 [Stenomitos rutilans HA7619-LM2]|nr:hypothetical protein [Stenomitos rutilans HA7619-LM2]